MFLLTDQGQHPIFLLLYPTGAKITGRDLFKFILDSIFQWEIKDDPSVKLNHHGMYI